MNHLVFKIHAAYKKGKVKKCLRRVNQSHLMMQLNMYHQDGVAMQIIKPHIFH